MVWQAPMLPTTVPMVALVMPITMVRQTTLATEPTKPTSLPLEAILVWVWLALARWAGMMPMAVAVPAAKAPAAKAPVAKAPGAKAQAVKAQAVKALVAKAPVAMPTVATAPAEIPAR